MCRLWNIALRDYQESVTTGQTDAGQSDPYVPLCFAGDTKIAHTFEKNSVITGKQMPTWKSQDYPLSSPL